MDIGELVSDFVLSLEINPGPPNVPPSPVVGELVSAFVQDLVGANPGPPNTPPNPVVGELVSEFVLLLETNPGPPTVPPSPVAGELVSGFVQDLVGINPGPPDIGLLGISSPEADWLLA